MTKQPINGNSATVESVGKLLKFQWKLPLYENDRIYNSTRVKRSNRYLMHQNIRISSLIRDRKYWEALQCFK